MASGASETSSAAYLRASLALPAAQRVSIRTLRPSVQPNSRRPCTNAASRACPCRSSAARLISTPMRRIRSGCCAREASGHVAAAPPISVMNSRRLMSAPNLRRRHSIGLYDYIDRAETGIKTVPQCTVHTNRCVNAEHTPAAHAFARRDRSKPGFRFFENQTDRAYFSYGGGSRLPHGQSHLAPCEGAKVDLLAWDHERLPDGELP